MVGLRFLCLLGVLACGLGGALAQPAPPLATVDLEMSRLCSLVARASPGEQATIRARLATLWRQRAAILLAMPPDRRLAIERHPSMHPQCLAFAQAAAAALAARPVAPPMAPPMTAGRPQRGSGSSSSSGRTMSGMSALPPPPPPPPPIAAPPVPPVASAPARPSQPSLLPPTMGSARDPSAMNAPPIGGGAPMAPSSTPPASANGGGAPALAEFLPWPPPAPSDRALYQLQGGAVAIATWGELADRLTASLRQAGFPSWGFYSAPGGFAVIPRVEQLDEHTGAALAGDARWASQVRLASTSVWTGLFTTQRPRGLYRVFALVLTTDPRSGGEITDPARTLQIARRWAVSGAADLPHELRGERIGDAHRLIALVYEFETAVGGATTVNVPGRWPLAGHFNDAGIRF